MDNTEKKICVTLGHFDDDFIPYRFYFDSLEAEMFLWFLKLCEENGHDVEISFKQAEER